MNLIVIKLCLIFQQRTTSKIQLYIIPAIFYYYLHDELEILKEIQRCRIQ